MKYLFFIQGEGRGHMTQAISLQERLNSRGHVVSAVIIGAKNKEKLPSFFKESFSCPIITIKSPSFETDKTDKGIRINKSVIKSLLLTPKFLKSIKKIREAVLLHKPDVFIGFYEPLLGIYLRLYKTKKPAFFIGHQYFMEHPAFDDFFIRKIDKKIFKTYNALTAPKKYPRLALSFTKEEDIANKNLFVCPPLIRKLIKEQNTSNEHFILSYILNSGYSNDLKDWSKKNKNIKIEAFLNNPDQEKFVFSKNLTFHHLNAKKFIKLLASCESYVSTAGFESISEAAYLQKNILMIPTKNHFEQECNAIDANRAKIARSSKDFDLSGIINKKPLTGLKVFKDWVDSNDDKILDIITK